MCHNSYPFSNKELKQSYKIFKHLHDFKPIASTHKTYEPAKAAFHLKHCEDLLKIASEKLQKAVDLDKKLQEKREKQKNDFQKSKELREQQEAEKLMKMQIIKLEA